MRARERSFLPPLLMSLLLAAFSFGAGSCGDGGSGGYAGGDSGGGAGPGGGSDSGDRRIEVDTAAVAERTRMMAEVDRDCARFSDELGRPQLSDAVRQAMLAVPRHEFVPADLRRAAYANNALPIGHDQTISQPTIVALMTDLLRVGPGDTVLEIGTGSGYQAAVLSEVCAHVYTIEIVLPLARGSRSLLAELGYDDVTVYFGDGWGGLPEHAPYAGIIVTAAPKQIPGPLLEQLAPGGRLVLPVGPVGGVQELVVVEKDASGEVSSREVLPVRFVPMTRAPGD